MIAHPFKVPKVAAAIVTYNHRDPVLKLLATLEDQKIPTFITENNGIDGSIDAIKSQFPDVSLLASPVNLGGCGGFNCAALAALSSGCEYLIFIDDDAFPEQNCISQLVTFLDTHPDYIFAAPAIYISSKPDTLQEAGGGVNFDSSNPIEAWYRFHVNPSLDPFIDIDYASACCLMVRAEALRTMGVMDWAYFIFSDDVDLCIRLRQHFNKKGACVTLAKANHDFPWAKPFAPMRLYFFQRNGLRLIVNNRQRGQFKALFIALMRLYRRIFYSFFTGDYEIRQTLVDALRDAWRGKFGNWDSWITFAECRKTVNASFFVQNKIKHILIDISIEDFEAPLIESLERLNASLSIDILCDENRVNQHMENVQYKNVFARKPGFIRTLGILPIILQQRYDMVITDATMEARRPSSMCAKHAAIYHNNNLYFATSRPYISAVAHLLSLPVGVLGACLAINHFRKPFPAGKPPEEAASLLKRIGVDPKIGQPYARLNKNV